MAIRPLGKVIIRTFNHVGRQSHKTIERDASVTTVSHSNVHSLITTAASRSPSAQFVNHCTYHVHRNEEEKLERKMMAIEY